MKREAIPDEFVNEIWNRPCAEWVDRQKVYLGWFTAPREWFRPRFSVLRSRTPWLKLVRCRHCGTLWYVATDTRDDDYYFLRLTDAEASTILTTDTWPILFNAYDRFWPRDMMRRTDLIGLETNFLPLPRKRNRTMGLGLNSQGAV